MAAGEKREKINFNYGIFVGILVICAILCRVIGKMDIYSTLTGFVRTMLYIGLYIGWGIAVNRRVVQEPVRRCLILISGLMVFWFVVRSMKYYFVEDLWLSRQLWYFYYLPMLFIPLLSCFVALLLGKSERYSLPKWARLLILPTVLCLFLVLTNDWHQLIFSFPAGEEWRDSNCGYEPVYYLVIGWESLCALAAFGLMVFKSRVAQGKKYLPLCLLITSIVYGLIYSSGVKWMQLIAGDITAAQCLLFTAILESCIQCGLIQTNSGYERLFEIGTIGAQIIDAGYHTRYTSSNAPKLSRDMMKAAENGGFSIDKGTLLKSSSISGGHVLWQEDIRDISNLLEKLEENRKTIEDGNCLEEENYRTRMKINTLREKNRLYDKLQKQTAGQVDLLDKLLTSYEAETDPDVARILLSEIGVIGAYIKRRGNLIFIEEKGNTVDTAELSACLEESFEGLRLMNVECALDIQAGQRISMTDAVRVYEFFEAVTEATLGDIGSVWLKGRVLEREVLFSLEIESKTDLMPLSALADSYECEDGVWRFRFCIGKAGGDV